METIPLDLTRLFIKVVQYGSFTKAADALHLPKSTLSKNLLKLETITGTKLLLRSTRSQTLTAAGRAFYEASMGPLQQLEEAQKSLYGSDSQISGKIKLTAPEDLGSYIVAPAVAELLQKHSSLSFELHFSNQIVDLIRDGFDLAVRIGTPKESQMKIRPIGHLFMVLVASPKYIKNSNPIKVPLDLKDHECLTLSGSPLRREWILKNQKQRSVIHVSSRFESNHMTSLLSAAIAGAGILFCPYYLCKAALEKGDLIRVLPHWTAGDLPVSILSPLGMASTGRLRVVVDELAKNLKKAIAI